ncbi:hypothetical protein KUTeg_024295 [Tegillarca granosa]|uniref:Uncharacterized protein n=1 Tax=Tegillarca granosa TaxID=220873 RepID=A0ABQ9E104_TEGGR|nr:hypothetical protein KUTeg_024295 [Tegillarca granosa]
MAKDRLHPNNGEDLTDTHVISKGKTECVVINSAAYSINNKTDTLKELTERRQAELPSTRELYHRFETNRRWMEYKKKLVEEIVKRKNIPNNTTISDIPSSLMLEPRIPDNLLI